MRGRACLRSVPGMLAAVAVGWASLAGGFAGAPAAQAAQGVSSSSPANPFAPGIPQQPTGAPSTTTATPTATPTTGTGSSNTGLGGGSAIAIAIGAILVLGGISFFIWRDARRRAPVRHAIAGDAADTGGRAGSKSRAKPRKLSPAERRRRKRGRAR